MRLSICIPTHDGRGWSLEEAIDSVLAQWRPEFTGRVQICVSDNGSRDQTERLLASYVRNYPGMFVLHRFEHGLPGHENFRKVVDMASGEYCWLLGSDDTLIPGAIDKVLQLLDSRPGAAGLTFGWKSFDRSMSIERPSWFDDFRPDCSREQFYSDPSQAIEAVGLYFMYMSAHVFRREAWQDCLFHDGTEFVYRHRHYMHVYMLSRVAMSGSGWLFCPGRLVNYRGENFSLLDELSAGFAAYRVETSEDLELCFRHVLGAGTRLYRVLMTKYFRNWFSAPHVADMKRAANHTDEDDRRLLQSMSRLHWYLPGYWLRAFPRLLVPHTLHKLRVKIGIRARLRRIASLARTGFATVPVSTATGILTPPKQNTLSDLRQLDETTDAAA